MSEREGPGVSQKHPHEPEIPPALDGVGRCRVCILIVESDLNLKARREATKRVAFLETEVRDRQAEVKRYLRERDAVKDALATAEAQVAEQAAVLVWALEQLRGWWRGDPRDTSDPAEAIAELDRMEAALNERGK